VTGGVEFEASDTVLLMLRDAGMGEEAVEEIGGERVVIGTPDIVVCSSYSFSTKNTSIEGKFGDGDVRECTATIGRELFACVEAAG